MPRGLQCRGMGSAAIVGDIPETKILEPEWKASHAHFVAQVRVSLKPTPNLPRIFRATVIHLVYRKTGLLFELKVYQGALSFKSERKEPRRPSGHTATSPATEKLPGVEASGCSVRTCIPFWLGRALLRARSQAGSVGTRISLFPVMASGPVTGSLTLTSLAPR